MTGCTVTSRRRRVNVGGGERCADTPGASCSLGTTKICLGVLIEPWDLFNTAREAVAGRYELAITSSQAAGRFEKLLGFAGLVPEPRGCLEDKALAVRSSSR